MDDLLTLVDEEDRIIGYENKLLCHQGEGLLHRAFSVLLFNNNNEIMIQRRSLNKLLWPQYWSNSVCSHPRKDERCDAGAGRRIKEELGICSNITYLYKFRYHAVYNELGSENEFCYVYMGRIEKTPKVNESEIEDWRFIKTEELELDILINPNKYTPWFLKEWFHLSRYYLELLITL